MARREEARKYGTVRRDKVRSQQILRKPPAGDAEVLLWRRQVCRGSEESQSSCWIDKAVYCGTAFDGYRSARRCCGSTARASDRNHSRRRGKRWSVLNLWCAHGGDLVATRGGRRRADRVMDSRRIGLRRARRSRALLLEAATQLGSGLGPLPSRPPGSHCSCRGGRRGARVCPKGRPEGARAPRRHLWRPRRTGGRPQGAAGGCGAPGSRPVADRARSGGEGATPKGSPLDTPSALTQHGSWLRVLPLSRMVV